jgi:hypothetical protein
MIEISIEVNGEEVKLTEFPAKIITNAVVGMLKSLHSVDEINNAVIKLEKKQE